MVSVGRCLPRGGTGLNTPSLVFTVRGLHVLCAGKLFASAQTMHKHHKAQHGADSVVPEGGLYAHSAPNLSECGNMVRAQAVLQC